MRIILAGNSQQQSRHRYALGTLLSALGVPHRFGRETGEDRATHDMAAPFPAAHDVELLVGDGARHSGDTAFVTLPEPQSRFPATATHPLDAVFETLARSEEHDVRARDQYERFCWSHIPAERRDEAARPVVSSYARTLADRLREAHHRAGVPMVSKEPWPDGRPMAACLTHDLDTVRRGRLPRGVTGREVRSALSALARGRFGEAAGRGSSILRTATGPNPYWTFDRIAGLEREHGFPSTYFVMAGRVHPQDAAYDEDNPRIAALLKALQNQGCEIGLHGSFASHTDAGSLRTQKSLLEAQIGTSLAGHRNHVLRFAVPASWRAHQAAGFCYDATLGFADHEGFRGSHAFPFHPYDSEAEQELELLEIPLAVMDVTIHKYRNLRDEEARGAIEAVLGQTGDVCGLVTLLWHNDTFFDADYPGSGRLYELALDWLASHNCWVAPCSDIDRWWRARDAVQISPLGGQSSGWRVDAPRAIDGLVLRIALPDPSRDIRCSGDEAASIGRDGPDHLVHLGRLSAGAAVEIRL